MVPMEINANVSLGATQVNQGGPKVAPPFHLSSQLRARSEMASQLGARGKIQTSLALVVSVSIASSCVDY